MCVATSVSIHVASATFPSVGCNLRRSTVSSSLLDRVLEIYELKCFFFFFFLRGMRRFLLSRAQATKVVLFFRRKVYRGEIMSRNERERDLMVA